MGDRINMVLNEGLRPENLGRYATGLVRSSAVGRKVVPFAGYFDGSRVNEALSPENLNRAASALAERAYRSAIDKVLGKRRNVYRGKVREYVKMVLEGDDLGADVNEVSAEWLRKLEYQDSNTGKRGKSPLGFNEKVDGRARVYIPRVGENVGLVVSQGIQDYIRVHELMETTEARPKGEREHEAMDATILDVLKEFGKTNARARQAYRGALSVYSKRGENDPYFRGVSKFYPVREEIRSNVFGANNKQGRASLAA